jgi:hypothetical protein
MVSGAIVDAKFLAEKWSQVALNLGDMAKEADIALKSTMKVQILLNIFSTSFLWHKISWSFSWIAF